MAKRKKAEGGDIPEWVVTYGDLMSLLLCFFILIAAFSEIKKEREYQEVVRSIQEAFGRALKRTRQGAEYSQEELALAAGVDRVYVSELERGLKSPTLRTVFKLAEVLEIQPSALVEAAETALRKRR